jgi:DNA adenine methylase
MEEQESLRPGELRYLTPLRYPGGKAKLAPFIIKLLQLNGLDGGTYVEPYAGGASVGLALLIRGHVRRIHINDLDPAIHSFWHSVLREPEAFCRRIWNRRVSVAEWRRQLAVQRDPHNHDRLELGFSTFFLNRTNRSGIICSGGMIGGLQQRGKWKLDARYNKADLVKRVERIAAHSDSISLHGEDAERFLARTLPKLGKKSFVYLDPPYYVKGTRRLYANFYEHDDHARIAEVVKKAQSPWLVSYDDRPQIRGLYREFRTRRHLLSYTARDRYNGREVLIFSNQLSVPR